MKLRAFFASALMLFTVLALAQSVPNGGTVTLNEVWTTAQWINAWQSKADTVSPALTGTPLINGVPIPTYPLIQAPTNQQFVNSGANIQKLNDRVMVGDAAINDGLFPNVTQDWLSAFQTSQAGGPANGTLLGVQMAVLGDQLTPMGGAFLAAANSLHAGVSGPDVLSLSSFAVNNNTSFPIPAWAYYGEAHRMNNTAGQTVGMEIDVVQRGSLQAMSPYIQATGEAVGHIIAAGAGLSATGQFNATAGIMFGANPMPFDKGIVFQATSIAGTNGVTGSGYAMNFAKGHVQQWWAVGSGSGVPTGYIIGSGTTSANSVGIDLDENFLQITAQQGLAHTRFTGVPNAVNYLNISHAATGNPVILQAQGSDTNVGLSLVTKGNGVVTTTAAPSGTLPAVSYSYNPTGSIVYSASDNAADLTGNGTNIPSLLVVDELFGGSSVNDGRNALSVFQDLTVATSATNAYRFYVAVNGLSTAQVNDHGTGGSPAGVIEGMTGSAHQTTGATNFFAQIGGEFTVSADTGSSVATKDILLLDEWPTDAVHGTVMDAAIEIAAHTGAVGMNCGICFDANSGVFPISTSGTAFRLIGSSTIFNGIDFGAETITSNVLQWNSGGFALSGAGTASLSAVIDKGTTFTVSGCGAAASLTGGSTAGSFAVGTGATPCAFTITMGGLSAPHGWVCSAFDITKNLPLAPTSTVSTGGCVVTSSINGTSNAVATSDVIQFSAMGY